MPILRLALPGENAGLQQAAAAGAERLALSMATLAPISVASTARIVAALPTLIATAERAVRVVLTMLVFATLKTAIAATGATTMGLVISDMLGIKAVEAGPPKEAAIAVGNAEDENAGIVLAAATTAIWGTTRDDRIAAGTTGLTADIAWLLALLPLLAFALAFGAGITEANAARGQGQQAGDDGASGVKQGAGESIELVLIHGSPLP